MADLSIALASWGLFFALGYAFGKRAGARLSVWAAVLYFWRDDATSHRKVVDFAQTRLRHTRGEAEALVLEMADKVREKE